MKPTKRWAIVTRHGNLAPIGIGCHEAVLAERYVADDECQDHLGERVVRVEIREIPAKPKKGKR
jgi:hypothetical protein